MKKVSGKTQHMHGARPNLPPAKERRRKRKRKKLQLLEKWQPMQNANYDEGQLKILVEQDPDFIGVFRNNHYQVTMRERPSETFGTVTWLVCRRLDGEAIHDWRHLQKIKNDLCGPEREGLELYPAESRLIDESNQYHLFVMGEGKNLPFGYNKRMVNDVDPPGVNKQRPFDDPPEDLNATADGDPTKQIPTRVT